MKTLFQVGDIVQTPLGRRGKIIRFVDGRAEIMYYLDSGVLAKTEQCAVLIQPHLLKFSLTPREAIK